MADDNNQRPYRPNDVRSTPQATPAAGNDPLAELARLIGQSDPFAEFGREGARRAPPAQPADWPAPPANPAHASAPAASAPATQSDVSQAQPYGAPNYEPQRYSMAPFASGAGLYRTEVDAAYAGAAAPSGGYASDTYYPDEQHEAADEDIYDDAPPPRRHMGIIAIAAVFALAVVGTAGAIGYRALFGSSGSHLPPPVIRADTTPSKIVPSTASKDAQSNKLITDRVGDNSDNEKLVSREEQPVEMKDQPAGMAMTPSQNVQPSAPLMPANGSGIVAAEPKKIRTIVIHPDQAGMADVTAPAAPPPAPARAVTPVAAPTPVKPAAPRVASVPPPIVAQSEPAAAPAVPEPRPTVTRTAPAAAPVHRAASSNAPLSLNPGDSSPAPAAVPARTAAPAAPTRIAPQTSSGGGYAVQVSSQRSEAEAEAAFKSMQAKYPSQLGGRSPMIHRVDLGAKGIYFRAMVGPFASSAEAGTLCSSLKSAGGQCIVQKI